MGSQLTKNFEVQSECQSEGGIAFPWKIYSATRRDREKTPVSIFIFEKKDKKLELISRLKSEISALLKLRHPNILQILEPMMEDATTITWISEPVQHCLGSLLRKPSLLSNTLGDTETRLGILDIIQGLSFIHNEARLVHFAVCPENIYIANSGKWKLAGLNFSSNYTQDSPGKLDPTVDILLSSKTLRYQNDVEKLAPLAFFTAPEVVSHGNGMPLADIFALGCSIYAIYKAMSGSESFFFIDMSEISQSSHLAACRNAARGSNPALGCLPEGLAEIVTKMISVVPADRGTLHELSISKSLQTPYVKTIYYLEHLQEKQDGQKMQFFKGLTSIISNFDKVIMNKRLLPALITNMQHPHLTPYILPSILTILRNCEVTSSLYQQQIWPAIGRLITGKEIPAQSFYLILSEIDLLVRYTEIEACKKVLMPLVFKGYDCAVGEIQTAIMDKTPDLVKELKDFAYVRQQLLPRFLQGIVNSKITVVKESGLKALSLIFPLFDRATMVETIIPSLEKFKKFDITGNMVMHLLTVYEGISKTLGHKATSVNILPALLPLLVEAELTRPEFDRLYQSMAGMMSVIKEARYGELAEGKEEQIVDSLKKEEIEEVNEIFKDIFDIAGKPVMEAPDINKPVGLDSISDLSFSPKIGKDFISSETAKDFQVKPKNEPIKKEEAKETQFKPTFNIFPNRGEEKKTEVKRQEITAKEEPEDLFKELANRQKEEVKPAKGAMVLKPRPAAKLEDTKAPLKFAAKKPQAPVAINTDDFFNEFLK